MVVEDDGKKLGLPPVNNFIPKNFDLLNKEEDAKPVLIKEWDGCTDLWYKKDNKFERPKVVAKLMIYSKDCQYGLIPKSRVFVHLWESMMSEYFREFDY